MTEERKQVQLGTVRPIHPEPLLSRFWPAFVAYVADLVEAGDLDCRFGFQTRCGNAGGCDPEALSRAVRQRLGRFGWPIAHSSSLRPREILDVVEFFFGCVSLPTWDICAFCEQRHIVGGDDLLAQENYTRAINQLFSRFAQRFALRDGKVRDHSGARAFEEPIGWPRVERGIEEIHSRLGQAETEEQFQAIGLLCREVVVSVAQVVYDAQRHSSGDVGPPSVTDAKGMLDGYIEAELTGGPNEGVRRHAKATLSLANDLQHHRTANYRQAALCAEATISVVNLMAIISGRRDRASHPVV